MCLACNGWHWQAIACPCRPSNPHGQTSLPMPPQTTVSQPLHTSSGSWWFGGRSYPVAASRGAGTCHRLLSGRLSACDPVPALQPATRETRRRWASPGPRPVWAICRFSRNPGPGRVDTAAPPPTIDARRPERAELPVGRHAHAVRARLPWRRRRQDRSLNAPLGPHDRQEGTVE